MKYSNDILKIFIERILEMMFLLKKSRKRPDYLSINNSMIDSRVAEKFLFILGENPFR